MSGFFTKLDHGIVGSTVWQAPSGTRLVWITMLAMCDQNGYVGASIPGLANIARVSLQEAIEAIDSFLAPDEWSRSKEYEGRRIAPVDGGWVLLNHAKYKEKLDADIKRERSRQAMAKLREERKENVNQEKLTDSNSCQSYPIRLDVDIDNKKKKPLADSQPQGFTDFWLAYPKQRREKKAESLKVWNQNKLEAMAETIIAHVKAKSATHDWQKDDCQFVPQPPAYLRGKRWQDGNAQAVTGDNRPEWMKLAQ